MLIQFERSVLHGLLTRAPFWHPSHKSLRPSYWDDRLCGRLRIHRLDTNAEVFASTSTAPHQERWEKGNDASRAHAGRDVIHDLGRCSRSSRQVELPVLERRDRKIQIG